MHTRPVEPPRRIILGAADPEMESVEGLAREAGLPVVPATAGGARVTPGTAYRADAPLPEEGDVWVECAPLAGGKAAIVAAGGVVADHHQPGDPGYGRPPEQFWAASSVGQVWRRLHSQEGWEYRVLRNPGPPPGGCSHAADGDYSDEVVWTDTDPSRYVGGLGRFDEGCCQPLRYMERRRLPDGEWEECPRPPPPPRDLRIIAAADHCLAAAYAGRCRGVDPAHLRQWRVEARARHQGVAPEEIEAAIRRAEVALRHAPNVMLGVVDVPPWDGMAWSFRAIIVQDLREAGMVPELPEAACASRLAYLATVEEPGGRRKVVLGGAGEGTVPGTDPVDLFLRQWAREQGLQDTYGDPARGFAGGYLP